MQQRPGDSHRETVYQENRELNQQRENVENQMIVIEHRNKELDKLCKQAQEQLETISGLSATEAKAQLIENLKDEAKTDAMSYVNEIMEEAKMTANKEAKKIVVQTITFELPQM